MDFGAKGHLDANIIRARVRALLITLGHEDPKSGRARPCAVAFVRAGGCRSEHLRRMVFCHFYEWRLVPQLRKAPA